MSNDVVGIRRATEVELRQLFEPFAGHSAAFDVDHWQRQSFLTGSFTYLAEQENIFGFVSAGSADLPESAYGEIYALWIAPEFRRQGWGRKLLVRGISVLKRRGFDHCLCYLSEDLAAVPLLQGLGFEASQYERITNTGSDSKLQTGYLLDISEYF